MVLTRDVPGGLEVLLLKRHPDSRFSPGAFAFPGGRVEVADAGSGIEARCRGLGRAAASQRLPDVEPPERAIGFWVAALREAFEEAGLLLAYGPDARPVDAATLGTAHAQRARCREDSALFGRLLADLDLVLATDRVAYWAHWITPEERPIRYDTRFFVAAAWPDQSPEPDGHEMVAARWIRPGDALARHRDRELVLPLPTQRILASVSEHPDVGSLLAAARGRDVRPVRPRIVRDGSAERILLPQDPGWF
jgi:8-oxo-dGTP pyrophosphatase MutT (NUDIX family)